MFFFTPPPDKSISHRALFFAALSKQKGIIKNLSKCSDVNTTLKCLNKIGFKYSWAENILVYDSSNFGNTDLKSIVFNCENSGTTARLLIGLLSSLNIKCKVIGDKSLSARPMERITTPLKKVGAKIKSSQRMLPIEINNSKLLKEFEFVDITNSAQVRSSILLAGISSGSIYKIPTKISPRDHTERMAKTSSMNVISEESSLYIQPGDCKLPDEYEVFGDPSSAFFLATAAILMNKQITIKDTYLNPTRIEAFNVLSAMGVDVSFINNQDKYNEPVGDIAIIPHKLKAIEINGENIPKLIDEIPMLSIVCCFASGTSKIFGLGELRYKESDRLSSIVDNLLKLGANVEVKNGSDLYIHQSKLTGGYTIQTKSDHRISMAFETLNLALSKKNIIDDKKCVKISFPNFYEELEKFLKHDEKV